MINVLAAVGLALQLKTGWVLQDQFGRKHTTDELKGRAVLLVASDRTGAAAGAQWVRVTLAALGRSVDTSKVAVVRVVDMRQVPVMPSTFARASLPGLAAMDSSPILLDYQGVFAQRYGIAPGNNAQLVIAPDGRVMTRARGTSVNPMQASILAANIRSALEPLRKK